MTAPSREDLDAAIDRFAERLVRNSFGGGAIAVALSADALSLSALLAYRASLAGEIVPLRFVGSSEPKTETALLGGGQ